MASDIPDDLMKPGEVAALLGVTVGAVYRWAVQGKLAHYRIGACRRFSRADVVAFVVRMEGKKPVPKPPAKNVLDGLKKHGLDKYLPR